MARNQSSSTPNASSATRLSNTPNENSATSPVSSVRAVQLPVPKFDVEKMNSVKWFEKYERECDAAKLNQVDRLRHLANHIGDAEAANIVLEHEAEGYQAAKQAVIAEYEKKNCRMYEVMLNKKYEWKMDVRVFINDKIEAGKKLKMNKDGVMSRIIMSFPAAYRWVQKEDQVEDLIECINEDKIKHAEMQKMMREPRGAYGGGAMRGQQNEERFHPYGQPYRGAYRGGQGGAFRGRGGPARFGGRYCYVCNDLGLGLKYDHISLNCTNNKDKGGRGGSKRSMNHMEDNSNEVGEGVKGDVCELIYFSVSVDGVDCCALYDPGSSISAIDVKMVRRLGIKIVEKHHAINSGQVKCLGEVVVSLKIGSDMKLYRLYVIDYKNLDNKLLLRLNCMKDFGLTHNNQFNIVTFDGKPVCEAKVSGDAVLKANILELNWCINEIIMSDECEIDELSRALNHIVVNDMSEIELAVNDQLEQEERRRLIEVIEKHKNVFASGKYDVGLIEGIECSIVTSDEVPVYERPYRCSLKDEKVMESIVNELLSRGIIRESTSEWSSPALLAYKKKEGKVRLVVNYKTLNDKCPKVTQPSPSAERIFDKLGGKKYFTTLDVANGYWHVKVRECDIKKTAFSTTKGQYEWVRMPFGYKNSPPYFQLGVYSIIRKNGLGELMCNYSDDMCGGTDSVSEHIEEVDRMLGVLESNGVKLKLSKCKFGYEEVEFLGHVIGRGKIRPKNDNVKAVIEYPRPKSKIECQRLLGKVNYNRKFIPRASEVLRPIIDLTCDSKKFAWSECCDKAFEEVKRILTSAPVLAVYNPKKKCFLFTDASGVGVVGVLKQIQSDNELHPIGYYSKALKDYQRNYTATELELLAIVMCVEYWHHYLYDKRFLVVTDHQALRYLASFKDKNVRLLKWSIVLSSYEFEVVYRVGSENLEADALSRAPIDEVYRDDEYAKVINMLDKCEIKEFQKNLEGDRERLEDIVIENKDGRIRVVVEGEEMEKELFRRIHENYNHCGVEKMLKLIRKGYCVKDLRAKLQLFGKRCESCIKNKTTLKQSLGYLSRLGPPLSPFDMVSIDTKGGFKGLKSNKKYLHIAIDHLTRFVWCITSKSQKDVDLINLVNLVCKDGTPKVLMCDLYSAMKSNTFKEKVKEKGIKLVYTCADSPQSNGTNERVGQTIANGIRCSLYDRAYNCAWTTVAAECVKAYNNTPHSVTGYAPSYLLKGECEGVGPFESVEVVSVEDARKIAVERGNRYHARNANYYNKSRTDVKLDVGTMIYCKLANELNREKYADVIFEGPFEVKRVLSDTRVEIEKEGRTIVVNKRNIRLQLNSLLVI